MTSPAPEHAQAVLNRYFEFSDTFAGVLGDVALALQLSHEVPPAGDAAAARRAIAEVNAALEQAWPGVPSDLLLRGPDGEGRGRLTVKEFQNLVTPGGTGALTRDKLVRRMTGGPAPSPARRDSLRLNQVTVPVSNLARSIAFYRGLGLQIIVRDESSGYARFALPDGGSTFSIHVFDGKPPPSGVVIYFECDDLDDRVTRLQAAGYAFSSMPVDQTWLWREATLQDPDGQQICLFHAGVNRRDPPWRLLDAEQ